MIDIEKREQKEQEKAKTRQRMQVKVDPNNYEFIPAQKETDYYDNDVNQRVGIYVRVSTDDVRQTTSFELQKKYYEDFVTRHPNWTLVKIYADEGISGTSLDHRVGFNEMISDAKSGKLDMIITKSVSRFARNVLICIGMVRDLAALPHPVGVFFESEAIFSLKDESQMALSFLATIAEEESHTRSRSMETSLRMRLDNGIPLTPKLLGYSHDEDGQLVINPAEAPTVKLCFYMYLYGYSTQQIADALIALGRKSYLGNICWTSNSIVQILRNERHCGYVLTRKTYTPDFRDHKSKKNYGKRPQSLYKNHHEAIVSRDDFIAVQHMLDNAKYGNKSFLPELRVITSGMLKGFVIINPRWAAFKEIDYLQAAQSIYEQIIEDEPEQPTLVDDSPKEVKIEVAAGDFDLRGFEITRSEFFDSVKQPYVVFANKKIKFGATISKKFGDKNYIELLVNPKERKFAIRQTAKTNRQSVCCSKLSIGQYIPREIPAAAFFQTLYDIFGWNTDYKYRIIGSLLEKDNEIAYIFNVDNSEAFFKPYILPKENESDAKIQHLTPSGKRIRAIPQEWTNSFGKQYYIHEQSIAALAEQSEKDWKLRIDGQLYDTGNNINVTGFDELRTYIRQELSEIPAQE